MPTNLLTPGRRAAIPALALVLAALVVAFPYVRFWIGLDLTRLFEPYAVGWLEPVFYASALRVFDGLPIYAPPSIDYVAPIYGPGMAVAGGLLFKLFGPGYPVLRMFSLLSLAGLIVVAGAWVRKASGSWRWVWLPGFFMLLLSGPMDHMFMRVNVDVPYVFLVVLALFLVHSMPWRRGVMIAAGVAVALACLFKQNAMVMAFAIGLYILVYDRKAFLTYAAAIAALLIPTAIVLHVTSDGWFWIIAGRIPAESIAKDSVEFRGTLKEMSKSALAGFVMATALLVALDERRRRIFWVFVGAAVLVLSYRTFCKDGSGRNCLLPLYVLGTIAPVLLLNVVSARLSALSRGQLVKRLAAALVFVAVFWMLPDGDLDVPARRAVSIPKYAAFDKKIRDVVTGTTGTVFVGARPDILYEAGKGPSFHQSPLYDGTVRTHEYDLNALLQGPLSEHHWEKMIVWQYDDKALFKLLGRYYKKQSDLGKDPLIGTMVSVWVPRTD